MAKVSVCLVTWNGAKFIKECLDSLQKQTYRDFEIQILDNASLDETKEILRRDYPQINVEYQNNNLGFTRAVNKLLLRARGEYALVVNQDTVLDEYCLEELVKSMDANPKAGAVGPLLYRLIDFEKSAMVDSFGLVIKKNYQVYDDLAGQSLAENILRGDDLQLVLRERGIEVDKHGNREVFGVSGALVMYRKSALESVRYENEYFDNDFFAYQEDFDLALRLRLAGWAAFVATRATAWHFRTLKPEQSGSSFHKMYNFRNYFLFTDKTANWGKYCLPITFHRWASCLKCFFTAPKIWWRATRERARLKKRILQKRQVILKYIKNSDLSMWMK
ncbi:MAG TPA: glycosyltransferase family 2 protein [bacterium]|nr:glycosyltransferase family 2 protein [bacterium]